MTGSRAAIGLNRAPQWIAAGNESRRPRNNLK